MPAQREEVRDQFSEVPKVQSAMAALAGRPQLCVPCLVSSAWAVNAKKLNKEIKQQEENKNQKTVAFGIPASSPDPPGPAEAADEAQQFVFPLSPFCTLQWLRRGAAQQYRPSPGRAAPRAGVVPGSTVPD